MEHRGTTITEIEQAVAKVDGLVECDACGRYFVGYWGPPERECVIYTSDILPESEFCSEKCRDEAELAAEHTGAREVDSSCDCCAEYRCDDCGHEWKEELPE